MSYEISIILIDINYMSIFMTQLKSNNLRHQKYEN